MTPARSTAQLLDAAALAAREPARAAELLAPFWTHDVPDDVFLGDRAAPPWTRVEPPLAKLLCLYVPAPPDAAPRNCVPHAPPTTCVRSSRATPRSPTRSHTRRSTRGPRH